MNCNNRTRAEIAILQLKRQVSDLLDGREEFNVDLYLLRWLKAQSMDVRKAEKMMRESLSWREENNCNQWLNESYHPGISKMINLHKGRCKNGAPVAFVDVGHTDLRKLIDLFGRDETFKFVMQNMIVDEITSIQWNEEVFLRRNCHFITEETIEGNVLVIDVKKASYRLVSSIKAIRLLRLIIAGYLSYFPDLGSRLIVVNCHRIVLPVINMMKPLVESAFLSVELYGTNEEIWKEALLRRIDSDQIPLAFGGTQNIIGF